VERWLTALVEAMKARQAYEAEAPDNPGRGRYTLVSAEYDRALVRLMAATADVLQEILVDGR
jgi:hypothetical protein